MNISVLGLGYVGCVSAACLAREGHSVVGVDLNPEKAFLIGSGKSPVVEPGLEEIIAAEVRSGRLRVSYDSEEAVLKSEATLVCVGTPSNGNGSLKMQYVENVCREIGLALAHKNDFHVVVIRSTVLPGMVEERLIPMIERHSGKRAGTDYGVCVNPEFLREGSAVKDYVRPGMVVIGEQDTRSGDLVELLYKTIDAPVVRVSLRSAEMLKYVSNAFHAVKVVFANEVGRLCRAQGIDGQEVMDLFARDQRLNVSAAYLRPGFAFGGSCLPKDLRALLYRAKELDVECALLSSVIPSNRNQVEVGIRMIEETGRRRVGVLGLSFKAGTDDVRESPAVALVETLVGRGYQVRVYDEEIQLARLVGANKSFLETNLPHIASLMCSSLDEIAADSEVLVVVKSAEAFKSVARLLTKDQILIDLVGIIKHENDLHAVYEGICW